jgi:hypothetical protein
MYFASLYDNRTKFNEIVLKGGRVWIRMMARVNAINVHCKYICKCHNEPPPPQTANIYY